MNGPTLTISRGGASLTFMLTQGFSEEYKNKIDALDFQQTHPVNFLWWGGAFSPIPITVSLAVDDAEGGSSIVTPEALVATVTMLYNFALCPIPTGGSGTTLPAQAVTLSFGNGWWKRMGYIEMAGVEWKPPWDSNTGLPMVAEVRFSFLTDFLADEAMKNRAMGKLPRAGTFAFDYITQTVFPDSAAPSAPTAQLPNNEPRGIMGSNGLPLSSVSVINQASMYGPIQIKATQFPVIPSGF